METVLLSAGMPSRFIVIKSNMYRDRGYAHYDKDGYARIGEQSVFSEMVKIEAERATVDGRYVNLRFCHSNKYWARKGDNYIAAESNKPEEDTTKSTCTLFEPVRVAVGGDELFYLKHVQSGGFLLFDNATSLRFYVALRNNHFYLGYLSFVNWITIVKLPKRVAFKGFNDRYLQAVWWDNHPYLQFAADDPNKQNTGYDIALMPDGHVRILSNSFNRLWRRDDRVQNSGWIWADSDNTSATANNLNTVFWPIKLNDNTIALRNMGNQNFCRYHNADRKTDCLDAIAPTIVNEARLTVEELVKNRKIFNVRYRMEDSRIFNESAFVAGTTTAFNYSDSEAEIGVEIAYEEEESYSLSRSVSLTAGVTSTIEFGIPIIANGSISVSYEISAALEWNKTVTSRKTATGRGAVPVPPRSMASISYVGTKGTCDVPFSYSQEDQSTTDGTIIPSEEIDGVYNGVNSYNFHFIIDRTLPLPA